MMGVIRHKIWSDIWHNKGRTAQVVLIIAMGAFAIGMTLATVMLSGGLFALFRFATDTRNYARPARD